MPIVFASATTSRPAVLVAADGEGQAEGEDQADDPEQRSLQRTDRLAIRLRSAAAGSGPRARRAQHAPPMTAKTRSPSSQLLSEKNTTPQT